MNYRFLVLVLLLVVSLSGFSQNELSIGFSTAYDRNFCLFQDLPEENTNRIPDYSIGADVGWYLGKRIRLRAEVKYVNISFKRTFDTPADNDDNVDYTKIAVNNLDFNPWFDYRLFSIKKLDVYATAGMKLEFTMGDYIRTFTRSGDKLDNTDYVGEYTENHATAMAGAGGGFMFRYNFTPNYALTISPEYISFFKEFYEINNMALQRASLKIGFEWSF